MFSICLPHYNNTKHLKIALCSILRSSYEDYEIIISDDNSDIIEKKNLEEILDKLNNKKIKLIKNKINLGYPGNLRRTVESSNGEYIYLFAQDDIMSLNALSETYDLFLKEDIGVVSRNFYMFYKNFQNPTRLVPKIGKNKFYISNIKNENYNNFTTIMFSLSQLSGLCYKRNLIENLWSKDIFTAHIYPWAMIYKNFNAGYLNTYPIAARIESSQTRFIGEIYKKSPTLEWIQMYEKVFKDNRKIISWAKKDRSRNFIGLLQIRAYGKFKYFINELKIMIKLDKFILLNLKFYIIFLFCSIVPPFLISKISDFFKFKILKLYIKIFIIKKEELISNFKF